MPSARRSTAATLGAALLAFLVVGLPLLRGGVGEKARLAAAVLGVAAFLFASWGELRLPRAGLALAAVVGLVVLQLVPVPPALHALAPESRRFFEANLIPVGLYPAARPFTLDLPATARELVAAVAGLSAFCAGWAAGTGRRRRSLVLAALAGSGLLVALLVLGGALIGALPYLAPRFPFVNPNHLAGFSILTAFPLLGLALRERRQTRFLLLLGFVAVAVVAVLSLSRAGLGALLFGLALFAILGERRDRAAADGRRAAFAGAVAGALALAAFLSIGPVLDKFAALSRGDAPLKISLWAPALTMVREHPLLGVGRGAFESTFTAYKTDLEQVTYTHLENEWLQPLVELGVPGGLLLVGTLALVWFQAARRRDLSWVEVGLLCGTAALAAQNAFDFSLELVGVLVPFMAALGLAARGAGAVAAPRWALTAAAAALLAVAGGGLAFSRAHRAEADVGTVAGAPDSTAAVAAARAAVKWRPADYVPVATAGIRLVDDGRCAEALPWLTRAMLLNPTATEPHLQAARCLAAGGQKVLALREFRLAWAFGGLEAFYEAESWYPDVQDLLQVAPDTPHGLMMLGFLLTARPAEAVVAYRRALDEYEEQGALVPLARALSATGQAAEALALVERRLTAAPGDADAWRLVAEIRLADGDEPGATDAARRGLEAAPGTSPLLGFLYERAMAHGRYSEARRLANEIVAHTPVEVASKLQLAARALAAQGRTGEAIEVMESAASALPEAPGPLLGLAAYLEKAGRFDEAISAVERAAALPGQVHDGYAERLKELEAAKTAQAERRVLQGLKP